jgi:nicotinamidase-related amidase
MLTIQACYRCLEAYSAFEGYMTDLDNPKEPQDSDGSDITPSPLPRDSEMAKYLRDNEISKVVIAGLASEHWYVTRWKIYTSVLAEMNMPCGALLADVVIVY